MASTLRVAGSLLLFAAAHGAPISDNGCQCIGDCMADQQSLMTCKVDPATCKQKDVDFCKTAFAIPENVKEIIKAATPDQIERWTKENIQKILPADISSMKSDVLDKIPADKIEEMDSTQIKKINMDELLKTNPDKLAQKISGSLEKFSVEQMDKVANLPKMTKDRIIEKIPADKLASLDLNNPGLQKLKGNLESRLGQIRPEDVLTWDDATWANAKDKLKSFSKDALRAMDPEAVKNLNSEVWKALPVAKIKAFAGKQIEAISLDSVAGFSAADWKAFPASAAAMFTAEQLQAGKEMLQALTVDELAKFDFSQLTDMSSLSADQKAKVEKVTARVKAAGTDVASKKLRGLCNTAQAKLKTWKEKLRAVEAATTPEAKASAEKEAVQAEEVYQQAAQEVTELSNVIDGIDDTSGAHVTAMSFFTALLLPAAAAYLSM